ncbi:hypothetical protein JW859_03530 [bacterium]|nr:hypothetical protein [bacterium]
MGGSLGHLLGIARNWLAAVAALRQNPLPVYWERAERRRWETRPWFRRNPALRIWALLVCLLVTAGLVYFNLQVAQDRAAGLSATGIQLRLLMGTRLLLYGAALFALGWLIAQWFSASYLALGFLETQARQRLRQGLDDVLATSALTAQDVLAATGWHLFKLILPPLATLAVIAALAHAHNSLPFGFAAAGGWSWSQVLATLAGALITFALILAGGALAALALIFMMISFSLVNRAGAMPFIGAILQTVLQGVLLAGIELANRTSLVFEDWGMYTTETRLSMLGLLFLLCCLLLYIARRVDSLRGALAYAFPLVLGGFGLLVAGASILSGDDLVYMSDVGRAALWALTSLSIAGVQPLSLNLVGGQTSALYFHEFNWLEPLLQFVGQLVFLIVCAEFARDAIRRRQWGTRGGDD